MTKIPCKAKKTIRIKAPLKEVYDFLADVSRSSNCYNNLEKVEKIGEDTYKWLMKEKDYGPLKFQVTYVLKYSTNNADRISWTSTGEGNTDVEGEVVLESIDDDATEVTVINNLASDIPIPRLMKAVAKPMAAKELETTIDMYLKNLKAALEG